MGQCEMAFLALAGPIFFAANFLTIFLLSAIVRLPLLVLDLLILKPVARLLSNKHVERIALAISFLLLILGSLIDIALS